MLMLSITAAYLELWHVKDAVPADEGNLVVP